MLIKVLANLQSCLTNFHFLGLHGKSNRRSEEKHWRSPHRRSHRNLCTIIRHPTRSVPMLRSQKKQRWWLQGLKSSREQIKEAQLSVRRDSLLIYFLIPFTKSGGLMWCVSVSFPVLILSERKTRDGKTEKMWENLQLCSNIMKTQKRRSNFKQHKCSLDFISTIFIREWHREKHFKFPLMMTLHHAKPEFSIVFNDSLLSSRLTPWNSTLSLICLPTYQFSVRTFDIRSKDLNA